MQTLTLYTPKPIADNPLEFTERPIPEPGEGQIRVKVQFCGVCHTDLHTVEGEIHPPHLPIIPGHQVVGVVDKVGSQVKGVKVGDRVGTPWLHASCGKCEACMRGDENLCPNAVFTGFHVDGGFAEYMLAEANYTLPIPDEISSEQAAPLLCAGIIGYRSLRKADLLPGERLGLVGFGASAHISIQVAKYWGCEVLVFTRSEEHRRHALELGAVWAGGIEENHPGKNLDRAVIFAPVGSLVPPILEKIRPGGTLAINAIHMSPIPSMNYDLIYGERTLRSVANATYEDGRSFLELAVEIQITSTIQPFAMKDANRALLDLKHSKINGEAVLHMV